MSFWWPTPNAPSRLRKRVEELGALLAERNAELAAAKDQIQQLNIILGVGDHTPKLEDWSEEDKQNLPLMVARFRAMEANWVAARELLADIFSATEQAEAAAQNEVRLTRQAMAALALRVKAFESVPLACQRIQQRIGEVFARDQSPRDPDPAYKSILDPDQAVEDLDERDPE